MSCHKQGRVEKGGGCERVHTLPVSGGSLGGAEEPTNVPHRRSSSGISAMIGVSQEKMVSGLAR